MILFDLQCDKNHKFECWFASSTNYEEQLKNMMIVCPYCNSTKIKKSLMAPNINTKSSSENLVIFKNHCDNFFLSTTAFDLQPLPLITCSFAKTVFSTGSQFT